MKPFLKWAGGKGRLLPTLLPLIPKNFNTYHEPFLGGGAMFFALASQQPGLIAYLSDINPGLIDAYLVVRSALPVLLVALAIDQENHCPEYYYRVREDSYRPMVADASRFIYLNKTCYNGLYRENSKGQFNVPMGRYKNPAICDAPTLEQASVALARQSIECRSFETVLEYAQAGDFVYLDPPYLPTKPTDFTRYHRGDFTLQDHRDLLDVLRILDNMGVQFMLSNSDTPIARELYQEFDVTAITALRAINSQGSGRGSVPELVVRNY